MQKQNDIRRKKVQIVLFVVITSFVLILLISVAVMLFKEYQKKFYPHNVVDEEIPSECAYMQSDYFRSLYNVALDLSSVGFEIYPYDEQDQIYHYDSKVYNRVYTNLSEGSVFLIGHGTGNIVDDIVGNTENLYSFFGNVDPVYKEESRENGYYNDYQTMFSTGRLSPNNFFRKGDFYISAMELRAKEDLWVLYIFTSDDITNLKYSTELIKSMANSMFQGNDDVNSGSLAGTDTITTVDDVADLEMQESSAKSQSSEEYNNATLKDMIKTDITFNENVDEWAVAYAKSTNLAETDYSDIDEPTEGIKQILTVTQLKSNSTREICFIAKIKSGTPLHAVLFSPDGMSYYEPTRYEDSGEFYFYVTNPVDGIWKCVLELKDCKEDVASLDWHGITNDSDRDYYLLPATPYVTDTAKEVIEQSENSVDSFKEKENFSPDISETDQYYKEVDLKTE